MGVQLGDIVAKKEISLDELNGREVAIDAFNALYQFLSIIRQPDGTPLLDSKNRITSHLSGLFYRTVKLVEYGVKPAYVFDGEPPEFKGKTLEERKKAKQEAAEKLKQAQERGDLEAIRKYAQATSVLTDEMIKDSKALLEAMGIPVVQAPSEGEAQAAFMCAEKKVWAAGSQDYDSLLFGSPRLLRNLTITGKRKLPNKKVFVVVKPELISLEDVLKQLGISREELVEIGLMIGTDFNEGVKGIGPKKALELVKKGVKAEQVYEEHGLDPEGLNQVREFFLRPKVTKEYELKWSKPDKDKVIELLVEEHDFSRERIEQGLVRLEEGFERTSTQQRIDKWF